MVSLNNDENRPEGSMNSISDSFEKIDPEVIEKQTQALESLLSKAKTPSCKSVLERLKSFLGGEGTTDYSHLNEIYKYLIQSLGEEPELDRSLVCKALGLDAELDNASDLEDLIKVQIAGFNKGELLEMLYSSQISYGDGESKLEKEGFKTRKQFKDEGYQIIKFYENELIQDEYCQDNGYTLEERDVGYALKADNSCTRDAGCIFIGENGEVTIAYHGTRDNKDNMRDLNALLTKVQFSDKKVGSVHQGFYFLFKQSWPSVHKILQGHANDKGLAIKDLKINITGHSMGGALATIAALCLKETESVKDVHVATFGSPRVFYQDAAAAYSECLRKKTIRVACPSDPVPYVPFGGGGQYYKHVGKPLKLETGSRFNPSDHSLSNYLNCVKGIKPEIFKSDNNVSRYLPLAFTAGTVCSNFPKDVHSSNDKEFFEKVKEENRGIKLSEIPSYILGSEKELKQAEQERDELDSKVTQLTRKLEKFENTKAQLEWERDSVQQDLNKKTSKVTTLTKELEETKDQLTEKEKEISGLNDQVMKLQNDKEELESTQTQLEKLQKDSDAKTKEFEDTKAQLKRERDSVQQDLNKKTSKVTTLTKELEETKDQLTEKEKEISGLNDQVMKLQNDKEELESTQTQLEKLQKDSDAKTKEFEDAKTKEFEDTKAQLKRERDSVQQDLNKKTSKVTTLTKELEETKAKLEQGNGNLTSQVQVGKLKEELEKAEAELARNNETLEHIQTELKVKKKEFANKEKELESKTKEVAVLTEELQGTKAQLEESKRELGGVKENILQLEKDLKQDISILENKVIKLTEEKNQLNGQLNSVLQELEKNENQQLEELESQSLKGPNPDNGSKKLSAVSAQGRKQVTYASVSFVLSGALAVGASLTMFHLAMCITLAVAALTFLAVGCYCSYKANTALSNVEIDQKLLKNSF